MNQTGPEALEAPPEPPQATPYYLRPKGHPRSRPTRALREMRRQTGQPEAHPAGADSRRPAVPPTRALVEWHTMSPDERVKNWARLRNWVTWLHDRYELSTENRLPRCWAGHPALIEELWALMIWREEIYSDGQPGAQGQAARYWHAELRNVISAAATYASSCRGSGHNTGPLVAATETALLENWARAEVTAGIPDFYLSTPFHDNSLRISATTMRTALGERRAKLLSQAIPEYVHFDGTWWLTDVDGYWIRVTDGAFSATLDDSANAMAQASEAAARARKTRDTQDDTLVIDLQQTRE